MFGFRFIKSHPTEYLIKYRGGKAVRKGIGLSFFYFIPTTSLVKIPLASQDVPFIFDSITRDFQEITVQGTLTYRVNDPEALSRLMNFTLGSDGSNYLSEDPEKLPQRLMQEVEVLTKAAIQDLNLRSSLGSVNDLVVRLKQGMLESDLVQQLGVEVLGLSILAIRPTPETARALEAEARESILRESDQAIYARRNAAVEQERSIKENELNTEIAVEEKKRQIRETQMEAEKSVQQKEQELEEARMTARISLEEMNTELTRLVVENARAEADVQAYALAEVAKALRSMDPRVVQSLAGVGMDSRRLIARAFEQLAGSADKIGHLNISPDLLQSLLEEQKTE
jgi:hypothetical protein